MDSQVKKGNNKIYRQCRLTSFAKRALGLIFHVVVVQLSLMARAKLSFLVVNPTRYCFTFSLPSSTLFCLKSLVTFRKCRVALLMATLHSCKLSWCWTLLRMIIHSSASELLVRGQSTDIILQNCNHRLLLVLK